MQNKWTDEFLTQSLQEIYGYPEFQGQQQQALQSVLAGQDTLLIMPTGLGKSLCYQMFARLKGFTLVVSPLIALMKDQVDQARQYGFRCDFINSSLSAHERSQRMEKLKNNEYEFLFVTPERFRNTEFRAAISTVKVELFAVDEAHCVSLWGHDFRPEYSKLGLHRQFLQNPPLLALTATATPLVRKDILSQLQAPAAQQFIESIDRPNLALNIIDLYGEDQKIQALTALLHEEQTQRSEQSVIVYFSLIQTLERVAAQLSRLGFRFLKYHSDLPSKRRQSNQQYFFEAKQAVMLATPAFGLGINKKNISLVIHTELPPTLEAYYQEVGRAGRDGRMARGYLLWDQDDLSIQMEFIKWSNPELSYITQVYDLIENNYLRFRSEGVGYIKEQMNFKFQRDFRVETALNILERIGCTEGSWEKPAQFKLLARPKWTEADNKDSEIKLKNQQQKLYELLQFLQLKSCRIQHIRQHFGEAAGEPCGRCDQCLESASHSLKPSTLA